MKVIDTSGQQCPAPLIATKRALKELKEGESFKIITDSKTSFENISRFLKDHGTEYLREEYSGKWILTIKKGPVEIISANPEVYCNTKIPHFSKGDFIVMVDSDKMGEGEEDLGHLLMVNFMKALKDLDKLPARMIFYNSGVMLGLDGSAVSDHLREIEKMGVELLFCETCVNYYSLKDKLRVGTLSNMFEIAQAMASASNIIKP
jgi:selenium metabolism protein YedF